ncbi:MAG: macrolide ABC transporter ATP-binding protein [Bacteroidetes bacterium]|nr:MAG: macrolide ABC transporter ATP-binding protein [Bacteroidota bacterium]PIE88509.1 MAG: macrolide ABC transporter ATP-binding protein [Bacteroidota bacterium]
MARKEIIRLTHISRHFQVGEITVKALNDLSLSIKENEFVALMGPSGSGKSTLMNLLGCLDTPTEGHYHLNGIDVSTMNDDKLAKIRNEEIGFIFQTFNLLPRATTLENVMLPQVYAGFNKHDRIQNAQRVLRRVNLENRMEHRPNELSGGQRQRVAIARALINNPSLILADEPTGNLDTKTSLEIMTLLEEIHQMGNTIVIVTHEEEIALHAQRIIRMRDGMIESDSINDTPRTIHSEKELIAKNP